MRLFELTITKSSAAAAMCCIFVCSAVNAQSVSEIDCGTLQNHHGPFDYYTATEPQRRLVESHHLDAEERALARGNLRGFFDTSVGYVGGGLDYTLRAFPNHPKALQAVDRYGILAKSERPPGLSYRIECYYERALRFRAQDGTAHLLYGIYLQRRGRKEAGEMLEKAEALLPDDSNVKYNLGLFYFDRKEYEKSLLKAHEAYRLGFSLPGLRDKLTRANKWREDSGPTIGAPQAATSERASSAPQNINDK